MSRSRRKFKPDPLDVALARIVSDPSLGPSAIKSAQSKLSERAHARHQSLGGFLRLLGRRP